MTSSRYYAARLIQAFGIFRKNQRLSDAAGEMHLLREAEAQLGALVWEKVENVEELSVEYWNLRKHTKEIGLIKERLAECQTRLDQAHADRADSLTKTPEFQQELYDQRVGLLVELEKLTLRRDEIVAEAREVRRSYDGMKMKLEVLAKDGGTTEEVAEVKSRLGELKTAFSDLKQKRLEIGNAIEEGDAKVDLVDIHLNEKKQDRRDTASSAFQLIGDVNKEMSNLRAEYAQLDIQMHQLYTEIGRYVSRNDNANPKCLKAVSAQRGLVNVMRELRRSIALNHRLAGTA
jgi:uncharacterized coiled-coil DUF342 family protein